MQKGDFVYIKYIGKVKESGEIFDLTEEEIAKKEGIYNPEFKYGEVPVIVGAGYLIKGLDEELEKMNIGEKKVVEILPEKAFGNRREDLIKLIPESEFKKQNIEPRVGEFVNINGVSGRIVSISGGRVKVDFNHPLAGKTLIYEIEITRQVLDLKEKVYCILKYFSNLDENSAKVNIENETVEIETKDIKIASRLKEEIAINIFKWINEIKRVKFSEIFEKK
ncbi:MAG: peptidylprolyl isomerase [Candidatus Aenigmatarchaeota archaeon]